MEHMELYWEIVCTVFDIAEIGMTAWLFQCFVKPFLKKSRYQGLVGAVYSGVMLVLYFIPWEMGGRTAYAIGAVAVFAAMVLADRWNLEQKVFLAVTFYLLRWISDGIVLIFWNALYELLVMPPAMQQRPLLQLFCYAAVKTAGVALDVLFLGLFFGLINRAYVCREENMTKRELALMLAPSLSVLVGYWMFSFYENVWEDYSGQYLFYVYPRYRWYKALYQAVSFCALFAVIVIYQSIKKSRREEQEAVMLSEQLADMKRHIHEVESLYRDMRGLRHDMGNHVTVLENLIVKNEREEAASYLAQLKAELHENQPAVRSGNPVTDVILAEKKREAEKKGITFVCDFHYPEGTNLNAFDISVMINNAAANAIEAAAGCPGPYIHIASYRRKNAYVIQMKNTFCGELFLNAESGLPLSTKDGREHGFGLANIRKTAQKYAGDLAIEQEGDFFILSIMLMV